MKKIFGADIGHAHGAYKPPPDSMSRTLLSLAGFQVITVGRFWVIAEARFAPRFWALTWAEVRLRLHSRLVNDNFR